MLDLPAPEPNDSAFHSPEKVLNLQTAQIRPNDQLAAVCSGSTDRVNVMRRVVRTRFELHGVARVTPGVVFFVRLAMRMDVVRQVGLVSRCLRL